MSDAPPREVVLEFRDLAVGYGSKAVLQGLSHQVTAGQFVCLLGPNGAGKTTLLRTLAGLLPPLAGELRLRGRPYRRLDAGELARSLAVVLTERPVVELLTALELVCLGRHPHTGFLGRLSPEDMRQARRAMELVGAWDLAPRPLDQLSDGERQKLMLARALAQEPRVIILDEPTMHLDVKHRLEVMSILRGLCHHRGIAVVASMHDVDLAVRLADVAGLVNRGGITAWGPPETVVQAKSMLELYDLDSARYLPGLGVIEPPFHPHREAVFVAGGGATAAAVLRLLAKKGFVIKAGVLHQHDLDHQVATALGAEVVGLPPFAAIGPGTLAKAKRLAGVCAAVVDTGFPVGPDNRANLELLGWALEQGIPLISLRPRQRLAALLGKVAGQCRFCLHATGAVACLESLPGRKEAAA